MTSIGPMARRVSADWVLPVGGAPIAGGAVLVDASGRIAALGPAALVPSPPAVPHEHFAGAALLPGFVNAHTHLELTGFDGQADDADFPAWIRRIIALKQGRTPAEFLVAARQGVRDCWAAGITTVGDTGDSGAVAQALSELGGSGIAYQEVFGPDPHAAEPALAALERKLEQLAPYATARVRLGVSPHAPYSVSGPLYRAVAGLAARDSLPIAVHLAESAAESELLELRTGAFARNWESRGIPLPPLPGRSPVAWLDQLGVLGPHTLCIHVVRADATDIASLARARSGVAHCPRSNRRHGHGDAPLAALLGAGLAVGVGTDSVASVSPLDLLAEARAAQALAALAPDHALRLPTADAASALGLGAEVGTLAAGKWGDLTLLRLPEPSPVDAARLAGTVMARGRGDVLATYLAGRPVYNLPPARR